MYDVPEIAIQSFERIHGLRVTVHDIRGSLWAFLNPERFSHTAPLCVAVKLQGGQAQCYDLEVRKVRLELPATPGGRVHVCHAGFVEWVAPVYRGTVLEWVFFAGPRLPGKTLVQAARDRPSVWHTVIRPDDPDLPDTVEEPESTDILEHLRQLTVRISVWIREIEANQSIPTVSNTAAVDVLAQRRSTIRRFIALNHTAEMTLADLAEQLSLSPSRASHAVTESCGEPFQNLLLEARLRTASGLLRHSALSVQEVSQRSGFRDPAHFHRVFRRTTGMSPAQFRKSAGS